MDNRFMSRGVLTLALAALTTCSFAQEKVAQVPLNDGNDTASSSTGQSVGSFLAAGSAGSPATIFRIFIEFENSLIDSVIPPAATIVDVKLQLDITATAILGDNGEFGVFRLIEGFDEANMTWANQPSADLTTPYGVRSIDHTSTGLQTFNVTALVKMWRQDPSSNLGLTIRSMDESTQGAFVADSSEAGSSVIRPTLIVTYIEDPCTQLEDLTANVIALNLNNGIENSLDAKLDAAARACVDAHAGNNESAINILNAFINAVQAQSGNQITTEDADALIASAQAIIDLLNEP